MRMLLAIPLAALLWAAATGNAAAQAGTDAEAPGEAAVAAWTERDALEACQSAVRTAAGASFGRGPGDSRNWGNGDTFRFGWPRGSFTDRDGKPASALCVGSFQRRRIQWLEVNNKMVR